jgi:hypothetical protein
MVPELFSDCTSFVNTDIEQMLWDVSGFKSDDLPDGGVDQKRATGEVVVSNRRRRTSRFIESGSAGEGTRRSIFR